jgi:hypothetical protein
MTLDTSIGRPRPVSGVGTGERTAHPAVVDVVVGLEAGLVLVVVVEVGELVVVVPVPAVVVVVLDVEVVAPDPAVVVVVLDGTVVVVVEVDVVVVDFVTCETSLVPPPPPPAEEVDGLFETGATPQGPVLPERWGTANGLVGLPACVVPRVSTARKNPAAAAPSTSVPTASGRST